MSARLGSLISGQAQEENQKHRKEGVFVRSGREHLFCAGLWGQDEDVALPSRATETWQPEEPVH